MTVDALVYCANGLQGQAIVTELRRAGLSVRALVRDIDQASALRRLDAELASAALEDPSALARAHEDVHTVVFQLPTAVEPEVKRRHATAAISTIEKAGVAGVVYNAAVQIPRRAGELASFAVTADIEAQLRAAVPVSAVIRPTFLLQNLLLPWVTQSIASRGALVYPVARDRALSWTAAEDIGRLAAAIIRQDTYGHSIDLAAGEAINGDLLARSFSQALGRPIEFVSLPLDQFEAGVDAALGTGAGKRIGAIFRFIEEHPDDLDFVARTFTPPGCLPGFEPTPITDWIRLHRPAYSPGEPSCPPGYPSHRRPAVTTHRPAR
jgi:uncharacterized protein YbjT (DUF2867 family)